MRINAGVTKSPLDRDLTAVLAENLAALDGQTLSAADRTQIKRLILDHVGVCRRGAEQPWCLALRDWAGRYDGSGASVVFATALRTAPNVAALVNASAAHGMELDDTHDSSVSHPGGTLRGTLKPLQAWAGSTPNTPATKALLKPAPRSSATTPGSALG